MTKIQISKDGPHLSNIIFGVMKWGVWGHQLNTQAMLSLIEESIDYGVTTFDHADIYGNYTTEAEFGAALKLQPNLREQMQIITKCGIKMKTDNRPSHKIKSYDTSREHIMNSVENSLRNLNTDYIDILLIHRPDLLMDPEEIARTIDELKISGKVLHFGVSNFTASQFDLLNSFTKLVTNQVEASIVHMDSFYNGEFDQCLKHGVAPMAWSPLGGGSIFGDSDDPKLNRIKAKAEELREKHNASGIDQILLAWLMRHPSNILPVVGTARIERVKTAADATEIKLSAEEWYELWEAATGHEVA